MILGDRETHFVSLNAIIDQLREKREFDLNLQQLILRQKGLTDSNDDQKDRAKGINREID